jgi:hypothetical protein
LKNYNALLVYRDMQKDTNKFVFVPSPFSSEIEIESYDRELHNKLMAMFVPKVSTEKFVLVDIAGLVNLTDTDIIYMEDSGVFEEDQTTKKYKESLFDISVIPKAPILNYLRI